MTDTPETSMTLEEALAYIAELELEIADLKRQASKKFNPLYRELLTYFLDGPRSIDELSTLMYRENRTISQWLHTLKMKHGAEIVTLNDGKKDIVNAADILNNYEPA